MRKWTMKVHEFPSLQKKYYPCKVLALKNKSKDFFGVTLEFLSRNQTGRQLDINLPLPVRPQGITINFFHACGLILETGQTFEPKEAIGKTIQCLFTCSENNVITATSFKPLSEKDPHHA